ncbi:MAG: hypothetical protein HY506_00180 [Candidatus Yanofskybacteria bacterium]|nr:hypothetical protein [Candidatus Yanofskybacteria bacterium]
MLLILTAKPVLIGLHLGFAILGIDAFLWLFSEIRSGVWRGREFKLISLGGTISFILSWLAGGYYYVIYYGNLVKPAIKKSLAPWAHNIVMETKEHIFLFIIPIAVTVLLTMLLGEERFAKAEIKKAVMALAILIAVLGLIIGGMGFVISATARWG